MCKAGKGRAKTPSETGFLLSEGLQAILSAWKYTAFMAGDTFHNIFD